MRKLLVLLLGGGVAYSIMQEEQPLQAHAAIQESQAIYSANLTPPPNPPPEPAQSSTPANQDCHPSYSGCLRRDASDYDCEGGQGNGPYYTGEVRVIGYDVFELDRDGDGWGCEDDRRR